MQGQESATNCVQIRPDIEPSTFKAFLRFLYSGVLEEIKFEAVVKLVAAAEKYGVEELKRKCESAIRANLRIANVIDALLIADMHNCPSSTR